MRAIEVLLDGLIDYAGLYPPARLDMRSAIRNYLNYQEGKYGYALGRFVVDVKRIEELREAAGKSIGEISLSIVVSSASGWQDLSELADAGLCIEMVELKPVQPEEIASLDKGVPVGVSAFFEIPIQNNWADFIDAIMHAGTRAKLRMGGVTADAFPSTSDVASVLKELAVRGIAFKATAGLHHPVRSRHRLTYDADSPSGKMHGFVNLFCAAALTHFRGDVNDAERLVREEDPAAWDISDTTITWKSLCLSVSQVREVRRKFMNSFGSCSFEEPLRDLEALGWL
jgi:hypothetical protein